MNATAGGPDRRQDAWRYRGEERPPFAIVPGEGQESVWDYPRPPRLERDRRRIEVRLGPTVIARSTDAVRVLETASPPTFYLPPSDVRTDLLVPAGRTSHCEWKGEAGYWTIVLPARTFMAAAWSYPRPYAEFAAIRDYLAFYATHLECYVDSHRVEPQAGGFYGGWVTPDVVGPFKGERASAGW